MTLVMTFGFYWGPTLRKLLNLNGIRMVWDSYAGFDPSREDDEKATAVCGSTKRAASA